VFWCNAVCFGVFWCDINDATHCNTLHHTAVFWCDINDATHCITLHHTAVFWCDINDGACPNDAARAPFSAV